MKFNIAIILLVANCIMAGPLQPPKPVLNSLEMDQDLVRASKGIANLVARKKKSSQLLSAPVDLITDVANAINRVLGIEEDTNAKAILLSLVNAVAGKGVKSPLNHSRPFDYITNFTDRIDRIFGFEGDASITAIVTAIANGLPGVTAIPEYIADAITNILKSVGDELGLQPPKAGQLDLDYIEKIVLELLKRSHENDLNICPTGDKSSPLGAIVGAQSGKVVGGCPSR